MKRIELLAVVAAGVGLAACTVEQPSIPAVSGPSEFGLSVTLVATPDQLPRDGRSQSIVTVTVRDASGRPVSGQRLSVSSSSGTVSASDIVTASDGRATVTFIAPPVGTPANEVRISVVPVGDNAANAVPRTLSILLLGASNITIPAVDFDVTPPSPEVNQVVRFDASKTRDEQTECLDACAYFWDFGDGSIGNGRIVTHRFTAATTYTVTLRVVDAAGSSASTAKLVTVKSVSAPTIELSVEPTSPTVGQQATFTAKATPAEGHSIRTFTWNFGDGTTQTTGGPTTTKTFTSVGTFVVTVTATDDLGQQGSASRSITVVSGITFPSPPFTMSPTDPTTNQTVSFNASGVITSGGATITEYTWDFGEGDSPTTTLSASTTNTFEVARTYVIRLTVKDSTGRTATVTRDLTVKAP